MCQSPCHPNQDGCVHELQTRMKHAALESILVLSNNLYSRTLAFHAAIMCPNICIKMEKTKTAPMLNSLVCFVSVTFVASLKLTKLMASFFKLNVTVKTMSKNNVATAIEFECRIHFGGSARPF